jgi:hypothetical protein
VSVDVADKVRKHALEERPVALNLAVGSTPDGAKVDLSLRVENLQVGEMIVNDLG